ncbi:MAG: DUF1330 domain-containing protein [Chloroflexi bacterium]|nr:DUF1330 domain-containing protein [Chloroflexota bacterium]
MSAYVIVQGRIDDRERFDAYRVAANPTVEAHGGRLLGIGDPSEVLEGEQADLPRLVLIEFPSLDAAKRWYASAEYQAVRQLRRVSSESRFLLVEGD